jgi:hypothetical protein
MPNFKVGDTVLCIEGSRLRTLVHGNTYCITEVSESPYVGVTDCEGVKSHGWLHTRFVLSTPATPKLTGMTQFYKDREKG